MQAKNSYRLIGVAAAAAALASAAFAGGEAGKLELRDLGAKFVGYTTKKRGQRLGRRAEPAVRPILVARAPAPRVSDRLHPRRRRPRDRLARDARRPRRLGRLFRRRRLGHLRRRSARPRPCQSNASCGNGRCASATRRRSRGCRLLRRPFGRAVRRRRRTTQSSAGRRARRRRRTAATRWRLRNDLGVARRDRAGCAARAFGGRRQHVPRARPEPGEGRRHHRFRGSRRAIPQCRVSTTARH